MYIYIYMIYLEFPGHENRAKETIQEAVIQLSSIIKETEKIQEEPESPKTYMDISEDEEYEPSDPEHNLSEIEEELVVKKVKKLRFTKEEKNTIVSHIKKLGLKTVHLRDMLEMDQFSEIKNTFDSVLSKYSSYNIQLSMFRNMVSNWMRE